MTRSLLLSLSLILTACSGNSMAEVGFSDSNSSLSPNSSSSSVSNPSPIPYPPSPIEQVPAELSIKHFSNMRLQGSGLTLSAVLAQNEAYTRYAIEYASNGLTISGILNIPRGEGPFPLVLLNHGYILPEVYTRGRGLKREQDYLARQGLAVLHSDYRGHGPSDPSPDTREIYDAGLEYSMDVINAINAVKAANLPQIDASRIGMLGHSMGGGVTLNIITAYPDLIDAAVLYAPVHADAWENFNRWWDLRDEEDRTITALGTRDENPTDWDKLSSLSYLHAIKTPILLFQGTNDKDVTAEWSDFLASRLQKADKDIIYVMYPGEGHEFGFRWNDFMEQTAEFFKDHF